MKHPTVFAVTLLVTAALLCGSAHGADAISTDCPCRLLVQYSHQGQIFAGEVVELYRVAVVTEDGQYLTIDDFAPYPAALERLTDPNAWDTVTTELTVYADTANVPPTLTAVVDPDGYARFHGLQPGLYLLSGVKGENKNAVCRFRSVLVTLPAGTEGQWVYEVVTAPRVADFALKHPIPQTADTGDACLPCLGLSLSGLGLLVVSRRLRKQGLS